MPDAPYYIRDINMNTIPFDGPLRNAHRDRVVRDFKQSVHLRGGSDTDLLRSAISLFTLDSEGTRNSSIESPILECTNLDISDFLAC